MSPITILGPSANTAQPGTLTGEPPAPALTVSPPGPGTASRARLTETVLQGMPDHLMGVDGATVQISPRGGGSLFIYQAATGSSTWANPLTTRDGRIEPVEQVGGQAWLETGSYDLIVSYGGQTDVSSFEAVTGDDIADLAGSDLVGVDDRLDALETSDAEDEARLNAIDPRLDALETADTAFDTRLDAAEDEVDQIPQLVTDAVAADPTVVDAAEAAVSDAVADLDVLEAETVEAPNIQLAIVDTPGHIAFQIDDAGHYGAQLDAATVHSIDNFPDPTASEDVALAVTDRNGRLGVAIATSGRLTPDTMNIIAEGVIASEGMTEQITAAVIAAITSTLPVVCWGDSITQGVGITEDGGDPATQGWVPLLNSAYGIATVNRGVSGDTDEEIAARQGGYVFQVIVSGGSIPASGPVIVVPQRSLFSPVRGGSIAGTLALPDGTTLAGTFTGPTDRSSLSFTRGAAGSAIAVPNQLDASCTGWAHYRGNAVILWAGANDILDPDTVIANTDAMIGWLTATNRRSLVLSVLDRGAGEGAGTEKGNAVRAVNGWFAKAYGANLGYLDIRRYLIDRGLADAAITPTAQDNLDIAADSVPASLRTGGIHPNIKANALIARQVAYHLKRRGWA